MRKALEPRLLVGATAFLALVFATAATARAQQDCCDAEFNFGFSVDAVRSSPPFQGIVGDTSVQCSADGELVIEPSPGGTVPVYVNVISDAALGAQGWTLSIEVTGDIDITDATTDGTAAALIFLGGLRRQASFESVELADPLRSGGRRGAIIGEVLCNSCIPAVTLPSTGTESVVRLDVSSLGQQGAGPASGRIFFGDGLQSTVGQAAVTSLTVDGVDRVPCNAETAGLDITVADQLDCCGAEFDLGFSSNPVSSGLRFQGIIGNTTESCSANGGTVVTAAPPGGTAPIYANIISASAEGVQAWSFSVGVSGDIDIRNVTTEGTAGAPAGDGGLLRAGGFVSAEVVSPARNGGRRGAVAALVLCNDCTQRVALPPTGTESVLRIDVGAVVQPASGRVFFTDRLRGAGESVKSGVVTGGLFHVPCNLQGAGVNVVLGAGGAFQRGDGNNDGSGDLSDGVFVLNFLFLGGPEPPCPPAADYDGVGGLNITDAVYFLNYLFLGGPPPPAPFPGCGVDPGGQTCAQSDCNN